MTPAGEAFRPWVAEDEEWDDDDFEDDEDDDFDDDALEDDDDNDADDDGWRLRDVALVRGVR